MKIKLMVVGVIFAFVFIAVMLWFSDLWQPALVEYDFTTQISSEKRKVIGKDLRILFVGDTSFGNNYLSQNFLKSRGYDSFLEEFIPLLHRADLVVANLETPITNLLSSPFAGKKQYLHWNDLNSAPEALKKHNIHVVSLANNHTLDYGLDGLRQTLEVLQKSGITYFGGGLIEEQSIKPLRYEFTFDGNVFPLMAIAGFEYRWSYDKRYGFYAKGNAGGVNCWTEKKAANQLRMMRKAYLHTFIVAFPHWGGNYRFRTKKQIKLAHSLIDAGADLVIGHGAHMLQEIENYRGRWIIYSLGNFVFNSPGRYQKKNVSAFSLAASLEVTEKGGLFNLTLRLYPIFSDNRITNYHPRLVTKEERNRVQHILLQHSPNPKNLQKELKVGQDEIGQFLSLNIFR